MSGSWSNAAQNLIVLVEQVSGYSGLFAYSPAPGAGNLVLSIAAAAGTDPYGNAFQAGLTLYASGAQINLSIDGSDADATWTDTVNGSQIQIGAAGGSAGQEFTPPSAPGVTWEPASINALVSNVFGSNTAEFAISGPYNHAHVSRPTISMFGSSDSSASNRIDLATQTTRVTGIGQVGSYWVTEGGTGVPLTWQTPSYASSWAASSTFNGSANWGGLQFRRDAEDNVWLIGGFKATGAAGSTVFTLPAGYRPAAQWPLYCQQNNGGTLSVISLEVGSSGNVNVLSQVGGSVASGHEYLVNAKFPLGNLA
jgi:hypothetical protein